MANLVLVPKNNGEIRLCVYFNNLNKVYLKDNYPLPKMDNLLQRVIGSHQISMMDGFSGYNEVVVNKGDRSKTSFIMPWGKFMNDKMPFGLMNVGVTFQREMHIYFIDEK